MLDDPNILVIEETEGTYYYYKSILKILDIKNIKAAHNIFEIDLIIKEMNPDLIIIDRVTPNDDTVKFLLKAISDMLKNIPLILVLPDFSFEINDRLKKFHKAKLFIKPLEVTLFARTVYNLLPKKNL